MSEKEEERGHVVAKPSVRVVFGDSRDMHEIPDESIGLVVTSPPYFNAPHDYPGLFRDYDEFLDMIHGVFKEICRVLEKGRVAVLVVSDVRVDGVLYPIVADVIRLMRDLGMKYQERIIWRKPEGFIRISRRSGVLLQHPFPLYFYPDHVYEDVLVFKKPGRPTVRNKEESRVDLARFQREKWYMNLWEIANVSPGNPITKLTSPFPEDLVTRIITLYSYVGDTVLDPFVGSGTTLMVARNMGRHAIGYELNLGLEDLIMRRVGSSLVQKREDARVLDTQPRTTPA
jgi:DNA modification methylase